jgi:mono/diheme cytochrome c family protein
MKRASLALLCLGVLACAKKPFVPPQAKNARPLRDVTYERTPRRLARGKMLTEGLLQCFACHSDRDWTKPGAPPIEPLKGAGHVWWKEKDGTTLVAPNLTPDRETGAGTWTDDMLARAIREGVGHDGRPLHSQMWYDAFQSLSDEDVASVVVALRALPPVKRRLPPTRLAPARYGEIRTNPPITSPVPGPDPSDRVPYGRYLVLVADCWGCHTAFEAPKNPGLFGGGNLVALAPAAGKEKLAVFSRNITPDPSGIPYYDDALFLESMRTGKVRAREISPVMPWVVFAKLPDEELKAMFAFLKTLPPVRHVVDRAEPDSDCAMCGQKHGGGRYNKTKEARAIPIADATARALEGTYRFQDGFPMTLRREGGRLLAAGPGEGGSEVFTEDGRFFFTVRSPALIEPVRDASGRVTGLVDHGFFGFRATRVK